MNRPALASPLLPFAAAFASVGFLSVMDAFVKKAALTTGIYTASVLRSLIGAAIIAPLIALYLARLLLGDVIQPKGSLANPPLTLHLALTKSFIETSKRIESL